MPTARQLRRFAKVLLDRAHDPKLLADLRQEDPESDARLHTLWEQARGSVKVIAMEELRAQYEFFGELQLSVAADKWVQAGIDPELIPRWIRETPNGAIAKLLHDRGWSPNLHRNCRVQGQSDRKSVV